MNNAARGRRVHRLWALTLTILLALCLVSATGSVRGRARAEISIDPPPVGLLSAEVEGDLLQNGGLDGDYYHVGIHDYVAPYWYRWWTDGSFVPEYDRTRYDQPFYEGDRAQRYQGKETWEAGIWQMVEVTPCVQYELTAWTRNHLLPEALSHAKIGLDPTGTQLTKNPPTSGGVTNGLPVHTAWSREQTALWVWEELTAKTEAVANRVTAIFYSAPPPASNPSYDSYWDAASLIMVPFPEGRLPAPASWTPSGFVSQPTTTFANGTLTIEWETTAAASTQVWYTIQEASTPVTPTTPYSYTTYLPIISRFLIPTSFMTELDTTPVTNHTVTITELENAESVTFVALSRYADGTRCQTEASELIKVSLASGLTTILDITAIDAIVPLPETQRSR